MATGADSAELKSGAITLLAGYLYITSLLLAAGAVHVKHVAVFIVDSL